MRENGLCPNGCVSGKYGPSCDQDSPYDAIGCFFSEILQNRVEHDLENIADKLLNCRDHCIDDNIGYHAVVGETCHCLKNPPFNHRQHVQGFPSQKCLLRYFFDKTMVFFFGFHTSRNESGPPSMKYTSNSGLK